MKKILLTLIFTFFSLVFTSNVSAQEFGSLGGNCYQAGTPYFNAIWDAGNQPAGTTCEVYIQEGNSTRAISNSCKNGVTIDAVNQCQSYSLCIKIKKPGEQEVHKCLATETAPNCSIGDETADSCTGRDRGPGATPGSIEEVFGKINPPSFVSRIGVGEEGISRILTTILNVIYVIAGIAFIFMIVWSAWQWITSGGEKDKVAAARQRFTYAIIGLVILALAGVIIRVLGDILGFRFFSN